jgi:dihydrofolate reductase
MITSLIVAASSNDVIGAGGALPWYLPDDLRRFKRLTTGHPVVVGRLTHESIVTRLGRPLPGRTSVVLSSRPGGAAGDLDGAGPGAVIWVTSLADAFAVARAAAADAGADQVFVIGGASVYEQALPRVDRIYLTRVHREVAGDTSLPPGWLDGFRLVAREDRPDGATAGPGAGTEAGAGYSWLDYVREESAS